MMTRWSDIDKMFGAMGLLRNRLDTMFTDFDRVYGSGSGSPYDGALPRTNLYDRGEHFELIVEVPGLSRDDLTVKIQGNYLEMSGRRKSSLPEGFSTHRRERDAGSFSRSLTLPADVDANRVTANLKNGILQLTLPKAESAKPRLVAIN